MPISAADVKIVLSAQDQASATVKKFGQNAEKAMKDVEVSTSRLNGVFGSLKSQLLGAVSVTATLYLAGRIVKIADEYTLLDNKLKLVTKSAEDLSMVQEGLYQQALASHSSYASSVDLYARFAKATEKLGVSQSDLLRITETLNKAMIISGATQTEATNGIIQLSQGMASGVLRGEEFNSIMENGSRIARMLADYLQVDIGTLRKMASEGKITSEVMINAFSASAQTIDAEFGKMQTTIAQAMTDLQTAFNRLVSDSNKSAEGTTSVAQAISTLASTIDQKKSGLIELFSTLIGLASKLASILGNIGQSIKGWSAVGRGQLSIFDFATMGPEELSKWLEKNDNQLAFVNKRLEDARLEWVKWDKLTKQYPSSDPNSEFNSGKAQAAKAYNDILRERNAILDKQKWGEYSGGGLGFSADGRIYNGGVVPDKTKAKPDVMTKEERDALFTKDQLERVQQVWEDNEEWLKTHYFDPITGMYIEMSDQQVESTRRTTELVEGQFEELKTAIEGWGRDSANAIVDFCMTGKMSFTGMIDSMIKDIMRMMVYENITKPMAKYAGDWITTGVGLLGGLLGGGGNMYAGGAWNTPAGVFSGGGLGFGFHSGGVPSEPTFYRIGINPRIFDSAPRYHSGIGPNEVPAILDRTEGVFTQGQMKALGLMAGNARRQDMGGMTVHNYNIYAQDAKTFEDFAKRNSGILQNITNQGLRDNKTRKEIRGLLR